MPRPRSGLEPHRLASEGVRSIVRARVSLRSPLRDAGRCAEQRVVRPADHRLV